MYASRCDLRLMLCTIFTITKKKFKFYSDRCKDFREIMKYGCQLSHEFICGCELYVRP